MTRSAPHVSDPPDAAEADVTWPSLPMEHRRTPRPSVEGMASFDITSDSAAAPCVVYRLLIDGSTWPAWSDLDSFESEPIPDSPFPADDPRSEVRIFRLRPNVARERIVEFEEDRLVVYVILSENFRLMHDFAARIELHPTVGGGTRIRWRADWHTPFPPLSLVFEWYMRRFQQRMTDGLARYAEGVDPVQERAAVAIEP